MNIKLKTMKTHDVNSEVERTLELLKQAPEVSSSAAFNERLWERINEKYSVVDSFETIGMYRYRKAAMAIVIGLNVFIGLMLLYKGLTPVVNDRSTELESLASEYSLVSDMYAYSTENNK
jgi:hypothetical protein